MIRKLSYTPDPRPYLSKPARVISIHGKKSNANFVKMKVTLSDYFKCLNKNIKKFINTISDISPNIKHIYDADGTLLMVRKSHMKTLGLRYSQTERYEKGKLRSKTILGEGNPFPSENHIYDDSKRLIESKIYTSSGAVKYTRRYEYHDHTGGYTMTQFDKDGKMEIQLCYSAKGKITGHIEPKALAYI